MENNETWKRNQDKGVQFFSPVQVLFWGWLHFQPFYIYYYPLKFSGVVFWHYNKKASDNTYTKTKACPGYRREQKGYSCQFDMSEGREIIKTSLILAEFWRMSSVYQLYRLGRWEENSKDSWNSKDSNDPELNVMI